MKHLTNPDLVCHMEERHRVAVQALLEQAASLRGQPSQQQDLENQDEQEHDDQEDLLELEQLEQLEQQWRGLSKGLLRSGFSEAHVAQVRAALVPSATSLSVTLPVCLDWLCLHLPESGVSLTLCFFVLALYVCGSVVNFSRLSALLT